MSENMKVCFGELTQEDIEEYPEYDRKNPDQTHFTRLPNGILALPEELRPTLRSDGKIFQDPITIEINKTSQDTDPKRYQNLLRQRFGEGIGRKSSIIHSTINGKRTNNSGRAVLNASIQLKLNEVGIPKTLKIIKQERVRRENSFPIGVFKYEQKYNIEIVAFCSDGIWRRAQLSDLLHKHTIVRRWIKDGDRMIINRQPTLRESNFVSMIVKLKQDEDDTTISIHPAVLSCFDGDLDGDEVTFHIPAEDEDLKAELEKMDILNVLINQIDNSLTASIIQNGMYAYALENTGATKKSLHLELVTKYSDNPPMLAESILKIYDESNKVCAQKGISAGFSGESLDFMIDCGAKGKEGLKTGFREWSNGCDDDDKYYQKAILARDGMISKTLMTAKSGGEYRRMAYAFDDISIKDGYIVDMNKFIVSFEVADFPEKLQTSNQIGLQCVLAIIPTLTQNVLDSSHTVNAGEKFKDIVPEYRSCMSCTHPVGKKIYAEGGIEEYWFWLVNFLFELFERKVDICWFCLIGDWICNTGQPLGISPSALMKRFNEYWHDSNERPILKMIKFGNATNVLKQARINGYRDSLISHHSEEVMGIAPPEPEAHATQGEH